MNINIIKAEEKHILDCTLALQNSDLGRVYFAQDNKAFEAIKEGIKKEEILVAINNDGICLGFLWFMINGAFHSFPYLHIIAVKEEFRNNGIGKYMLNYFEKMVIQNDSKVFLVVADFNPNAKQLYQKLGYMEVGAIPNLYKRGVTEYIMMKELY